MLLSSSQTTGHWLIKWNRVGEQTLHLENWRLNLKTIQYFYSRHKVTLIAQLGSHPEKHKFLHNLNLIYFLTQAFLEAFTKKIAGKMKKFMKIWKKLNKHGWQVFPDMAWSYVVRDLTVLKISLLLGHFVSCIRRFSIQNLLNRFSPVFKTL